MKHRLIKTLAAASALAVLALLGYFASAGFAGPLSVLADTTSSTESTTTGTTTGSTTASTSSSTSSTTTTTSSSTSTSTPTTTATTTTTPAGPEGQIRLANGKISIPVTSVVLPARLVIDGVHFTPGVVTSRRRPVSVRVHVSDTRGYWVRGALVFVRSTPRVTSGGDRQATTVDGWVTYQLVPNGNFPKPRNGYNVQFFVKAYRSGDPALAGIAAYRLVQVPLAG